MVHEAAMHESNRGSSFVTLTYREKSHGGAQGGKHVPEDWSLDKRHFQLFMKRLRKARPGDSIKYYHCGEYGSRCRHGVELEEGECPYECKVGRPHYHACVFNCSFPDKFAYAKQGDRIRYTSPELEKLWGYGFVDVGEVTMESAAYVARYCVKKIGGVNAEDHYSSVDDRTGEIVSVEPEYSTMSNGLGLEWYRKFKDDVFPSGEVPVPGSKGRIYRKVPRYYDELLRKDEEETYESIKAKRKEFALENAEEYSGERLLTKFNVSKARQKLFAERNLKS